VWSSTDAYSDDRERAFQFIVNALGAKRRWFVDGGRSVHDRQWKTRR
jgi:hypothetical protein